MINGPMKRLLVAGLVATGCGAFAQAAHSGDQAALLVAGIAQSGIAVGTPGDTVSQWWEVRRADVGTRSNHQADRGGAFVKLGDIKGEYQPSDETQSVAYMKLGDIKGEYQPSDETQSVAYMKLGDIKGEYQPSDETQSVAFVKLGDIKGEYQPSDETQSDAFVKLGDIKGEYTASGKEVEGHVDSSDIALLMSYYGKPQGDVNGDGKSDIGDLAMLMDWMGKPRIELLLELERGPEDSDDGLSWNDDAPAPKAASQLDGGRN